MNEIEKRMNAAMDLVTWLDHRIEQQVEYQLEQRLAQEGSSCDVVLPIQSCLEAVWRR
jgi:hypothetical protein